VAIITINSVNDAPVAKDNVYSVTEERSLVIAQRAIGVLGNDSDVDNEQASLTARLVSGPQHGTLVFNANGTFSYAPNPNFAGADSFTYQALDHNPGLPEALSNVATVTLNVANVNDAPVAADDSFAAVEDTELQGNVLANDTDADGNPLAAALASGPAHGSLTLNADGSFSYLPAPGFSGADGFAYRAGDGQSTSNPANVLIDVQAVNDAPVLGAIGAKAVEELATLEFAAQASDDEGDALAYSLGAGAPDGASIDPQSGVFTWTPSEAQGPGTYDVTVRVAEAASPGVFDEETITIEVAEVDSPPTIEPVVAPAEVRFGDTLQLDIGARDDDLPPEGVTFSLLDPKPANAAIDPGTGAIVWTPSPDQIGKSYEFAVRATDEGGLSDTARFTIMVTGGDFLKVRSIFGTTTGFHVDFDRAFNPAALNLYDAETGGFGPADVVLAGPDGNPVRGSIILDADADGLTFVKTGGPLAAGEHTVTLRSAVNGFVDVAGEPLDGNGDGANGDNFQWRFTVGAAELPSVGLPDFMRGPGQTVEVPGASFGNDNDPIDAILPVRISSADGLETVSFKLRYDPTKLEITGVALAAGLPTGAVLAFDIDRVAGVVQVGISGLKGAQGTNVALVTLAARVPAAAAYGSSQLLDLTDVQVNGAAVLDDDAVHLVGYFGDATADAVYSAADVDLLRRVVLGADGGFQAYPLTDPLVAGDINSSGDFTGVDHNLLQREANFLAGASGGQDRVEIPPIPGQTRAAASAGPAAVGSVRAMAPMATTREGDSGLTGLAAKPISLDVGPTIDWSAQAQAVKRRKEPGEADARDAKSAWRGEFVNTLGQSESERNPNGRMRVTGVTDKDLGKPLYLKAPKTTGK
jgi:VCBS repeat-containing protein